MKRYSVRLASILLLLVLPFVAGCSPAQSGVRATLEPGPTAALGGEMVFTATVSYPYDVPNDNGASSIAFSITLSPGVLLLDSGWTEKGRRDGYITYNRPTTFQGNVPQTFDFHIRLEQPGTQIIYAGAVIHFGATGQDGNGESKVLDVSASGTTVRDMPLAWPTDPPTP